MTTTAHVTVVGDALLDRDLEGAVERIAPDAPVPVVDYVDMHVRPGGAALAACLAREAGATVRLVTAIGRDHAGAELRRLLAERGVELCDLGRDGATAEKIRVRADGHALVRIDRGGAAPVGAMTADVAASIAASDAVLVADYGNGVAAAARAVLADRPPQSLVWDPHPRGVAPVPGATVVTPNYAEACRFAGAPPIACHPADFRCATDVARTLRDHWHVAGVAVTLGDLGALYVDGSSLPLALPAARAESGDPCGAGDCFAAHLAFALARGAVPSQALPVAVAAAGAYVGARSAEPATPPRGRPGGDTLVATSGCFDLVHAGHVHMLHAARRLGDRLVVLLNSDASVRRLKGPHRPIVPQADRAELLRALRCVDDVVTFDEDTPVRALDRLRPHVFVKGGDYGARDIPESDVLAAWGGRAVVVPYLNGRSTTALAREAIHADHRP